MKTIQNHFDFYWLLLVPEKVKDSNLSILIEPETPFIAVTSDRKSHMLISMYDLLQCSTGGVSMCDLRNVIRETSCAMSLMSGSQNEVDHYCSKHIVPFPQPVAFRLGINGR